MSPPPQLPCLPSPLLSAATSSKTGPVWQHGGPVWRLHWALSLSRRLTGSCYSRGTPNWSSRTPSWPRSWCSGCRSGSAERELHSPASNKHAVCPPLASVSLCLGKRGRLISKPKPRKTGDLLRLPGPDEAALRPPHGCPVTFPSCQELSSRGTSWPLPAPRQAGSFWAPVHGTAWLATP